MTSATLLSAGLPLLDRLFPPASLIEQVHRTPRLIFAVLGCCLAAAFLALWRAAPDFRAFRSLGIFYALVGGEQFCQYFGGLALYWTLVAFAAAMLVEAAGEETSATSIPDNRMEPSRGTAQIRQLTRCRFRFSGSHSFSRPTDRIASRSRS